MNRKKTMATAFGLPLLAFAPLGAQAQSSVSISGQIDIGVFRNFDKRKNVGTIQRSYIAFSGTEDLGDGLAATFRLGHRFDADTGTPEGVGSKPFWHEASWVGLKGGFGHVRLGRALDVISANDWAYDPWFNYNRIASPAWQFWHFNYASDRTSNNGSAEFGRLANGVFYDSPTFGGFTAHFSGAFENTSTAPGAGTGNNHGVSLNYDQGPVSLMLARSRNSSGDTVLFAGAKYTFGALSLMGAYDKSKFEAAIDSDAKVYTLGASYVMGQTTLKAGYGRLDLGIAKNNFYGVGADYALSKRTSLYASAGTFRPSPGTNTSAYGVGIAHSF